MEKRWVFLFGIGLAMLTTVATKVRSDAAPQVAGQEARAASHAVSHRGTAEEAASELYSVEAAEPAEPGTAGYTQFLAIDNGKWPSLPDPNHKYYLMVEVVTVYGEHFFAWFNGWADVALGEKSDGQFYKLKRRVKKCRFWWKSRKFFGRYHKSDWVKSDPGHYIVYAQIEWFGKNDYVTPIYFYQDSVPVTGDAGSGQ